MQALARSGDDTPPLLVVRERLRASRLPPKRSAFSFRCECSASGFAPFARPNFSNDGGSYTIFRLASQSSVSRAFRPNLLVAREPWFDLAWLAIVAIFLESLPRLANKKVRGIFGSDPHAPFAVPIAIEYPRESAFRDRPFFLPAWSGTLVDARPVLR